MTHTGTKRSSVSQNIECTGD